MNTMWIAPGALALLALAWCTVQRAWLHCMGQPPSDDALSRPGCGSAASMGCCGGSRCTLTEDHRENRS
jgi:hypothetical protein